MQFLYPAFLWALTALSIPVILHLFYFRRYKKVYFSNLRFLREVKEETSARNRLRNILILISRLLAMAFIILAFAQPFIPSKDSGKAGIRNVSMFVDNSFSMQSFGQDLSLFDKGRQKAREIILGYGQEDRFQILGHDLSPAQNLWIDREEALLRLEEMDYTPAVVPLSIIAGRQKQGFSRGEGIPVSWMISDFQKSITDIETFDSTYSTNLLALKSVQEKNVAIDSAWFDSPVQMLNQNSVLLFSIHNYTPDDADNIRVTISLDGQERPEGTVDITGGQIRIDTSNITVLKSGWHEVMIRISDFPVTFDDSYYLSFYVRQNLKILTIHNGAPSSSISAVFSNPQEFIYDQTLANQVEYAGITEYDLIILQELSSITTGLSSVLLNYVKEGGKVLFFPSSNGSLDQYNALMRTMGAKELLAYSTAERQGGKINTDAFVYNDVFNRVRPNMRLPLVKGSYPQAGSGSRGQSLISFRDGGDLITFYANGKGAFAAVTAPLDQKVSDLSLQPEVFVPLLYKMAIYTSDAQRISYIIGRDQLVALERSGLIADKDVSITGPAQFIPGMTPMGTRMLLDVQGQILESGFYQVKQDNQLIASLAFNYDRLESDLSITDVDAMPSGSQLTIYQDEDDTDFTQLIQDTQQGKLLWKWCIVLALFFIACEIALIRLWKNA